MSQSRSRWKRRNGRSRRTELLAGFWFLTLLVSAGGPLLAVLVFLTDKAGGQGGQLGFLVISPDSARTILGNVAGSLITIASLTASLTIVTLQLRSNQYTPRAVRGFLRRQISQVVAGSFIGIFLYCLLLLVTVRAPGDANQPFVPSLGVALAVALALYGLVMLVVFINTLARTIQVSSMTAELARDTAAAITAVHSGPYAGDQPDGGLEGSVALRSGRAGYVQRIDLDTGLRRASAGGRLSIAVRAGDFVTFADPVAYWTPERAGDSIDLGPLITIGHERDIDQDPGFGIRQLIDIALRAISPGINDPTTAVTCLRYVRGLIELLAERDLPPVTANEVAGVRVTARGWTYQDYLHPLTEIARYATTDARVTEAMVDVLVAAVETSRAVGASERERWAAKLARELSAPAVGAAATEQERAAIRAAVQRCGADPATIVEPLVP